MKSFDKTVNNLHGRIMTHIYVGLSEIYSFQECDIVAAPISIQAERTRVCDFAYPFFWEFSTVVLKKPDPNDRKWRTMIDPFKWNVLLCIGKLNLTIFLAPDCSQTFSQL